MRIFNILETSYSNFTETITNYLNKMYGGLGQAYTKASVIGAIFEGIKGVMQNMMFYIEDAMTEQNAFTAVRKKSIYSLAKISGYDPYYGSTASGTVLLSNKISNSSSKIIIEDESVLMNDSTGTRYSLDLATDSMTIDMTKPLVSYEVKVVQGTWNRASATAKGEALETIEANVTGLFDTNYLKVYVNGEEYGQSSCLYDMTEDEHSCVVKSGYEGGFSIMFGNGYHGHVLTNGDQVTVKYIVHDGASGNLMEDGTLKFSSTIYDTLGNAVEANDLINITMNGYICGGSDSDTVSNVRELVGMNSRALVLGSEDSFKMFLRRFSFIGQFSLHTSSNSTRIACIALSKFKDKISNYNDYLEMTESDMMLSDDQKNMVIASLENSGKSSISTSIEFVDPIVRRYSAICYVKSSSSTVTDALKNSISKSIVDYFMSSDMNTKFISKSDVISYVMKNVSGIRSFDVDFVSEDDEIARKNGYWYSKEEHLISGQPHYVDVRNIYDKTDMIGLDEAGNIRLKTDLEMPILHRCTMVYDDWTESKVDPIQFFFL